MSELSIRPATVSDWPKIWLIIKAIVQKGDTYGIATNITEDEAFHLWMTVPTQTVIAEINDKIVATYYLKANFSGPGAHVCNCGYMVAESYSGQGIATRLCKHSQQLAKSLGFKAMQFNYVASSNNGAIYIWKKLGFVEVGRLPKAFNHPEKGFIDALVMYKWLIEAEK